MPSAPKKQTIGLFPFMMVTLAIIITVRNIPTLSEAGMQMFFYMLVAVVGYLLPCALVSAELGSGWPQAGGVYVWVKEAFGERFGFTAIWLQWFQMTIGMVMLLTAIGGTLAYAIDTNLETSKLFILAVSLATYWIATMVNMKGLKTSSMVSTFCVWLGVFIPGILIILLGIVYVITGNPIHFDTTISTSNMIPDIFSVGNLSILIGFVFVFLGLEVSAAHVNNLENPQHNYPLAVLVAALITIAINLIGALAVASVIPQSDINLVAGIMQAIDQFLQVFGLTILIPVIAILIAVGGAGQISTWVLGPSTGLLITGKKGNLPLSLQQVNKNGVPRNLLILQAGLVSFFCLIFAVIPGINQAYWQILAMTTIVYGFMYLLVYLSVIRLRYLKPGIERSYKIPGGVPGVWLVAGLGFAVMLLAMIVSFVPPEQVPVENISLYLGEMVAGTVLMIALPFVIYHLKRPSWKDEEIPDETGGS
ncbi:amino acid permease [Methanogenium sp. MK-MG]|uniref:amino acid permease n=1 Tax=Methanogenium sp. MK-MG TaxID=2599926 RepID=UPI0013ED3B66|nr:amino acid permease [Methanogenium sp. MK-MG]KAF1073498.1 hypothetical protein MKMG_02143 [Methanogenium sp. MK-MG]